MSRPQNGDSIAGAIQHHLPTDTDFSDVAHALSDAHAHRPGLWQQDLQRANDALHERGILQGMDIVGLRGQDLVTRDSDGHTHIVDASYIASSHEDKAAGHDSVNGRPATQNPDGSGTVEARRGDNRQWQLSQDILKSQGIDHPSPNQMANFQMELERLNGKPVSEFKPGDQIKVPPSARSGESTEFVGDRADRTARQADENLNQQTTEANAALEKFDPDHNRVFTSRQMSLNDIDQAMKNPDLSPADARGLKFLHDNFGAIANGETTITHSMINQWEIGQEQLHEQQRLNAYRDSYGS